MSADQNEQVEQDTPLDLAVVERAAEAMYERMRLYRRPHWAESGLGEPTRARYRAGARAALEAVHAGRQP